MSNKWIFSGKIALKVKKKDKRTLCMYMQMIMKTAHFFYC